MAEWGRELDWRPGGPGFESATLLLNFGNSVYPALPVSFGGDTKSRRSLLSGVYARGSKISHQSALVIMDHTGNKSSNFCVLACEHDVFQINKIIKSTCRPE